MMTRLSCGEDRKMKGPGAEEKRFYPDYLAEILATVFLALGAVFILAMLFPPAIGREINFVAAYQPKPEWYFLWLYELVRYFPGKLAFLGTVAIPLFVFGLVLSIPRIDSGSAAAGRVAAVSFILVAVGFLILTLIPLLTP